MSPNIQSRTSLRKNKKPFSGFIAYYSNGKVVHERENYFSRLRNKKCATNWGEIDKGALIKLELYWKDELKGFITKESLSNSFNPSPITSPNNWFFSQKGYFDLGSRNIIVVSRNIGYIADGVARVLSVLEDSGIVQIYSKKAAG